MPPFYNTLVRPRMIWQCRCNGGANTSQVWRLAAKGDQRMALEYRSAQTWRGMPLVHVAFGSRGTDGRYHSGRARGLIAVGDTAMGVVAVGVVAVGVVAAGPVALGLIAAGVVAVGLVSVGVASLGLVALGVVAIGLRALGVVVISAATTT
jgi:hypothetical protein